MLFFVLFKKCSFMCLVIYHRYIIFVYTACVIYIRPMFTTRFHYSIFATLYSLLYIHQPIFTLHYSLSCINYFVLTIAAPQALWILYRYVPQNLYPYILYNNRFIYSRLIIASHNNRHIHKHISIV